MNMLVKSAFVLVKTCFCSFTLRVLVLKPQWLRVMNVCPKVRFFCSGYGFMSVEGQQPDPKSHTMNGIFYWSHILIIIHVLPAMYTFSYWYTQCVMCMYIYMYMHIIGQPLLWNGGWPLTNDYRIRIRSRQWWWMMNSGLLLENEVIFPHHWWLPSWSNWLFYPSTDHQIWSVESVSEMFGARPVGQGCKVQGSHQLQEPEKVQPVRAAHAPTHFF